MKERKRERLKMQWMIRSLKQNKMIMQMRIKEIWVKRIGIIDNVFDLIIYYFNFNFNFKCVFLFIFLFNFN